MFCFIYCLNKLLDLIDINYGEKSLFYRLLEKNSLSE